MTRRERSGARIGDTVAVHEFTLAVAHGSGHDANALILAILGVFALFMSFAVTARTSGVVDPDEPDDVDPHSEPGELAQQEWLAAERRRARMARRLRPALAVLSAALLLAAIITAVLNGR